MGAGNHIGAGLIGLEIRPIKENVFVGDVWDTDDKETHATVCGMHDARGNVQQRAMSHRMNHAIKGDGAFTVEHVINLCALFMIMWFGVVDVNDVRPCDDASLCVFLADEAVSPTAGAAFFWSLIFVSDKDRGMGTGRPGLGVHWITVLD